jgi:hypothetical protein
MPAHSGPFLASVSIEITHYNYVEIDSTVQDNGA